MYDTPKQRFEKFIRNPNWFVFEIKRGENQNGIEEIIHLLYRYFWKYFRFC